MTHWFEELADHMGEAYLRYSFTKGTANEVAFLIEVLGLEPGMKVLDVGCGPGRHALALAAAGIEIVGVDISQRFVDIGNGLAEADGLNASFQKQDARQLSFDAEFDAAYSLCQGAFGISGGPFANSIADPDGEVLRGLASAVRPNGQIVCSAFSAPYLLRNAEEVDFDVSTGVHHEMTEVLDSEGVALEAELWTTCFTPKELRLLFEVNTMAVDSIWSVSPGDYAVRPPDLEHAEFLVLAHPR